MTLPFKCDDCGGPITLTPDEGVAIYEHRINLCQDCIDFITNERDAYESSCSWDSERQAFVAVAPSGVGGE